jgi:hypothetical protein
MAFEGIDFSIQGSVVGRVLLDKTFKPPIGIGRPPRSYLYDFIMGQSFQASR